ncbi:MAG: hypothetical protein PVG71_01410 [Anaerolineae bacterium]
MFYPTLSRLNTCIAHHPPDIGLVGVRVLRAPAACIAGPLEAVTQRAAEDQPLA